MSKTVCDTEADDGILMVQALFVTAGPFKGRICENDDDDFTFRSEFSDWEVREYESEGIKWSTLEDDDSLGDDDDEPGVNCEIVTFGFYHWCRGYHCIPRQFLRPATMKDLVQRMNEIEQILFEYAFDITDDDFHEDQPFLSSILLEQSYILNQVWKREMMALKMPVSEKALFLCHASIDKPFVRQVRNDLSSAGHTTWMDEFEIKVGDSIVEKIDSATARANALLLFMSKASSEADWVKREWQSALSRSISGKGIKVLPLLIEECEVPSLISDIKYADFRTSYRAGLNDVLEAVAHLRDTAS